MDAEIHMIQNERIDEIAKVIHKEFDELLDLQDADEKGEIGTALNLVESMYEDFLLALRQS